MQKSSFFMKKAERQHLILERVHELAKQEILPTRALAEQFAVSETTIRRDLQQLADAGLIQRQYGGAHPSHTLPPAQVGILLASRIDKYRDPFYNMVLEGADKKLEALGLRIAYIKTTHDLATAAQAKALLSDFSVKGLIVLGTIFSESLDYLRQHLAPIVTVTDMPRIEDDEIMFDGERGMCRMVEHLAKLGYRRLGYIAGYEDLRYSGFCQGLVHCHLPRHRALHQILKPGPSGWTPDLGERGARSLMQQTPPPDAIVCASDRLAIGAMQWLQQNGYHIPTDIAVTGFDNIPDAEFAFPPLTTVQVHKIRLGELAAERLAHRLAHPSDIHLKITVPTTLVIRRSCGHPA